MWDKDLYLYINIVDAGFLKFSMILYISLEIYNVRVGGTERLTNLHFSSKLGGSECKPKYLAQNCILTSSLEHDTGPL